MFFKMLKSDLKQKKGLSIVLFLFILIASMIVSVGSVQLYEFFTGNERNQAACNHSDAMVLNVSQGAQGDIANKKVSDVIKKNKHVKEFYSKEVFTLMPAYIDFDYVDEEKTNETIYGGYYHTGDSAWKDEDGYYWYKGRIDDIIKSSGYKIGPYEVESALLSHSAVLDCAVTGIPHPIRGQIVKATIVLSEGYEASEELTKDIQNHVKHVTAPYKYPRAVEYVDELPKTISGKIMRKQIRVADEEKYKE